MDKRKRRKLAAAGWVVGSTKEFLGLTDAEAAYVDFKAALSGFLRSAREGKKLSQEAVARRIGSSQSRIAKMEAADASVSIDLLLRSLFSLGAQPSDIAKALRARRKTVTASRRRATAART
jgi:DNA-binding XRE family transcriptional regulator